MGLPIPGGISESTAAFIRTHRPLHPSVALECSVVQCEHTGLNGEPVVEALVVGRDPLAMLHALHGEASVLTDVAADDWVHQSILAASGRDGDLASPGMLGIYALRASREEWHLVSHPRALSAVDLLSQMSRCFDRWIEL